MEVLSVGKLSKSQLTWMEMGFPINSSSDNPIDISASNNFIYSEEEDIDNHINFLNNNCKTISSSTSLLTKELYNSLINGGGKFHSLKEDNKLIALVYTIPIRCRLESDVDIKIMYSTYLTVNKQYRKKGISLILINKVINSRWSEGIRKGYCVTLHKYYRCYSEVDTWYRPINIYKLRDMGYQFKLYKRSNDRSDRMDKLAYSIPKLSNDISITISTVDDLEILILLQSSFNNAFIPTVEEWNKYISSFNTYTVKQNNIIIGIFTLTINSIQNSIGIIKASSLSLSVGDQEINLKCALNCSSNCDLLQGILSGGITKSHINIIKGVIGSPSAYIEIYNGENNILPKDISFPFL